MTTSAQRLTWEFDTPIGKRSPVYTRANAGEVAPNLMSPLYWTTNGLLGAEPGWRDALTELGAFDRDEFEPESSEALACFGGYLYLSVSVLRRFAARTPGMTPEMMDQSLLGDHPDTPPHAPSEVDESSVHGERITKTFETVLATRSLPELEVDAEYAENLRRNRPDLTELTAKQLVEHMRSLATGAVRTLLGRHIVVTMSSTTALGALSGVLTEVLGDGDGDRALDLVSGLGDVVSARMAFELWDLGRIVAASPALMAEFDVGTTGLLERLQQTGEGAAFRAAFAAFVDEYEYRGVDEFNMVGQVWGLHPEVPLAALDRMRFASSDDSPTNRRARMTSRREAMTAEVLEKLSGQDELRARFESALASAKTYLSGRERSKSSLLIPYHEIRLAARELGARYVASGHVEDPHDIQLIGNDEIDGFLDSPESFRDVIAQRREVYAALAGLEPPFIINGTVPTLDTWARKTEAGPGEVAVAGTVLHGIGGCPGAATGVARVIVDPSDPQDLDPGDILVAPHTDPAWTPLFTSAGAVVVDSGAPVSHAVIISRELGIPCVVSAKTATSVLRSGMRIRVDGDAGTVTVLE